MIIHTIAIACGLVFCLSGLAAVLVCLKCPNGDRT